MKGCAAGLCAAVIAATAMAVPVAEAQTPIRKKQYVYTTTRGAPAKPRARVTVAPRSFLDAGTEVRPGDRKFTDYAFRRPAMAGSGSMRSPIRRQGRLGPLADDAAVPAAGL